MYRYVKSVFQNNSHCLLCSDMQQCVYTVTEHTPMRVEVWMLVIKSKQSVYILLDKP